MTTRQPNANEKALRDILGIEGELKRHSRTIYEWRGLYLEVLTVKQMKRGKVPASWYTAFGEWRIREMGKQAEKVKKILHK
jgi:hypothetical protein